LRAEALVAMSQSLSVPDYIIRKYQYATMCLSASV
jgi:hypothetical protein